MFTDTSPGPCKYALARVHDWIADEVRLPIVPPSKASRAAVDAALASALSEVGVLDSRSRLDQRYRKFRDMGRLGFEFVEER